MSLDLVRARVAFRDRAFTDVLDLAVRFVVVHAKIYARVALVVLALPLAATLAAARLWGWTGAWIVVRCFLSQRC